MKKLDFRNFSVPTGITRQTREVFDAREQIADLLYLTGASGTLLPTQGVWRSSS